MSILENKVVVSRFIEVIWSLRASRSEIHFLGQQPGREGLKAVITLFRTAFPNIHWIVDEVIGEGDKVCSRFTWTGTHAGEFMGVAPTGKRVSLKSMVIDRVPSRGWPEAAF